MEKENIIFLKKKYICSKFQDKNVSGVNEFHKLELKIQ